MGLIPSQITHGSWPKNQNMNNRSKNCNKFNKIMCSGHLEETELLLKWRSFQGLIQKSALQSTLEIPGHVELEGSHHRYRNRMRKRLENHRVTINAWDKMDS